MSQDSDISTVTGSTIMVEEKVDDPLLNKEKFRNRRQMAWLSLVGILLLTGYILAFVQPENVSAYDTVLAWAYGTLTAIVLGYMGMTTYAYDTYQKSLKK